MIILNKWEAIHLSSFMFFSATFVVSGYWITYNGLSLVGTSCTSLHGMTRDLSSAERHGYLFICEIRYCRDNEINIDGLPDYRMGELADVEEIEFFSDSGEESQTQCF